MSKTTGLGSAFYIGGYDISGDVNSLSGVSTPIATLDVTGIDKFANERLDGLADGTMSVTTVANVSAGQEQKVLSNFPRTDTVASFFVGKAIGNAAASINAKQVDYAPTRGNDGLLTSATSLQGNKYGLEWGWQLTAGKRTDTAATDGTAYDSGAAHTNGCQIYLHVFAATVADADIVIESASDSIFTTPQTEATYTVGSAPAAVRLVGGNSSVNRYWRVSTTTTGGITSLTFAAAVTINRAAVYF